MRMWLLAGAMASALGACSGSSLPAGHARAKLAGAPLPDAASRAELGAALASRASDLVKLLNGEMPPALVFDPAFLAQLPADKVAGLARTVTVRYGRATGVERLEITEPNRARVFVKFEEKELPVTIVVHPKAPHLLIGLLLK